MYNLSQQDTYGWCSVMGYNSHINMQSNPSDETKYSMYCMDVRSSAYTIEFREDSILQNVKKMFSLLLFTKIDFCSQMLSQNLIRYFILIFITFFVHIFNFCALLYNPDSKLY